MTTGPEHRKRFYDAKDEHAAAIELARHIVASVAGSRPLSKLFSEVDIALSQALVALDESMRPDDEYT